MRAGYDRGPAPCVHNPESPQPRAICAPSALHPSTREALDAIVTRPAQAPSSRSVAGHGLRARACAAATRPASQRCEAARHGRPCRAVVAWGRGAGAVACRPELRAAAGSRGRDGANRAGRRGSRESGPDAGLGGEGLGNAGARVRPDRLANFRASFRADFRARGRAAPAFRGPLLPACRARHGPARAFLAPAPAPATEGPRQRPSPHASAAVDAPVDAPGTPHPHRLAARRLAARRCSGCSFRTSRGLAGPCRSGGPCVPDSG